jgi:thymidylate synthase (FAD)
MKVTLAHHTPDPERTCAEAAALCYSPGNYEDVRVKFELCDAADKQKSVEAFLTKVLSLGHNSVVEHASFTFAIDGISRTTSHQLVRHRIASYSQQSQRYVKLTGTHLDVVIPDTCKESNARMKRLTKALEEVRKCYNYLVKDGVPAEDARYILPNATCTNIIVTMNARELLNFFTLRCCKRAQWEIREMARCMLVCLTPIAPTIFKAAGPACLRGPCPEGVYCCGKQQEVKEIYKFTIVRRAA